MNTATIEYKGKKSEIEVLETRNKTVFGKARFEVRVSPSDLASIASQFGITAANYFSAASLLAGRGVTTFNGRQVGIETSFDF